MLIERLIYYKHVLLKNRKKSDGSINGFTINLY